MRRVYRGQVVFRMEIANCDGLVLRESDGGRPLHLCVPRIPDMPEDLAACPHSDDFGSP